FPRRTGRGLDHDAARRGAVGRVTPCSVEGVRPVTHPLLAALSLSLVPAVQDAPAPAAAPAATVAPSSPQADAPGPPAPDSVITRVVVCPRHAEITREVAVPAEAGENVARFTGLVPGLHRNTLRASVPDGARITGTELRKVYLEESLSEEIAALDAAIQALNDELSLQARAEARVAEEAAFYKASKGRLATGMDRGLAGGAVAVGDWKQVLAFVAEGLQASAARNEPLRFGFGPDDSLVVERRLVGREVKGPEAFRQSQVITCRCEVTVQNFNQRATEVEVTDQIPVSKTPEIQVTFLDSSLAPQVDRAAGTLRWTLEVGPGATSTISYAFSVESPVGREVHWL
ncbi:MAG: DUF4139 domain-containing protein, partial [Planctomycetes bacterium]|nr:DUF4139 domain-containing protein [Planctomycetota bacterium]